MSVVQQSSVFTIDLAQNSVPELQEKFKEIIFHMVHDLGSPLMALSVVAENSKTISEKERSMLKESASRIREICAIALDQFKARK